MKRVKGKRIFVGVSGGVDSAVAAALLMEQGADVVGVFLKGWYPPGLRCTWEDDRRDAMRVAAYLGIPFHTLDASREYKQSVIDYLVREYGAGRTPNPDIMCNRDVKFGAFYEFARANEADAIATGHYARNVDGTLMRGKDGSKDQSYFLWAIGQDALQHALFPLGEMRKADVRARAAELGLPNALKRDSQGICFLGPVSMDDFLRAEIAHEPGRAMREDGTDVGTHEGVLLATLGERIALKGAPAGPWYVIRKDIPDNVLVVSNERRTEKPMASEITLTDMNWFDAPRGAERLSAQYRYHGPLIEGTFAQATFTPSEPLQEPLASGQSLVLYRGDAVAGGGIIK